MPRSSKQTPSKEAERNSRLVVAPKAQVFHKSFSSLNVWHATRQNGIRKTHARTGRDDASMTRHAEQSEKQYHYRLVRAYKGKKGWLTIPDHCNGIKRRWESVAKYYGSNLRSRLHARFARATQPKQKPGIGTGGHADRPRLAGIGKDFGRCVFSARRTQQAVGNKENGGSACWREETQKII